ncbi:MULTISPECIES: hypothetical protein [Microcystis]|jgi:cysteine desulfurase|uniref:hypothetical protein n=1 Tax=Microcystis TaxID=1125 RepID=UPI002585E18E|nr:MULTISPECIES: hypothetical protein [Microcystis]MCA2719680.1 hypothetical protein [Microcystis sp. M169S2]WNF16669.1 hypothetical protein RKE53_10080 [Microcystis aeruginosa NRERC-214]
MSEKQKRQVQKNDGYQAKIDKPPGKPPTGGSNVKPPLNQDKEKNNPLIIYAPFYLFPVLTDN